MISPSVLMRRTTMWFHDGPSRHPIVAQLSEPDKLPARQVAKRKDEVHTAAGDVWGWYDHESRE